jgi:rhamnogalacturonyl hydrolase YesR
MLAENNYGVWAVKMKIFMHAKGMWAAVESKGLVDEKMDQMTLAVIVQAVAEAVVMGISEEETTEKAWKALEEMHVGEECVKKAQVQPSRGSLLVCTWVIPKKLMILL